MRAARWPARGPRTARSSIRIAGEERWIAIEDAARYRDAVGASPPPGVAETFLQAPATIGRSTPCCCAGRGPTPVHRRRAGGRWGMARARVEERSGRWRAPGVLLEGAFRPGGAAHEFTDPDVLRQLRRRSLARLRREVEPVAADASPASCRPGTASARRPAVSAGCSR